MSAVLLSPLRGFIEQAGATVRFLPPYSHDFNPIEAARVYRDGNDLTVGPRRSCV